MEWWRWSKAESWLVRLVEFFLADTKMVRKRWKEWLGQKQKGQVMSHHIVKASKVIRASDLCCLWLSSAPLSLFLKGYFIFSFHILEGSTLFVFEAGWCPINEVDHSMRSLHMEVRAYSSPLQKSFNPVHRTDFREGYWCWHQKKKIEADV